MPRSVATSAPRFPAFLSRPPLPLIIGALFALLLLGLFLSSPPTPSLPTSVPAHDRLANFHPVSEVRWAIIGCGDVTEKKSGPALALIPSSRLVAVMRRNATLAQDYAQRHHVPRWSTNAEETINDADVNAVYIATPHRYHKQYAIMAARAGKPAYVEKPMGMSHVDSSDILAAFQRAKLPLFVAYYRRTLPNFLRIKALLESGAIGDVLSVQVVYHRPPNKYDYQWALSGVPSQKELQTMLQQQQQEGRGGNEEGSGAREQQQRRYPYRPLPQHHPPGASLHNATLKWRVDPLVGGLGGYFRDKGSHQLDLLDFWFGPVVSACEEGELGECAFESTQNPPGASLHNATLKWHVDPLVSGLGGYFWDKGSHQLDLLDFWFGPVVSAGGRIERVCTHSECAGLASL
ncbi:unnamed protein product [Closterium sp. Naga37s-1]|nr:unnamed protein product [Closterium sp. Naga37s-1]